MMLNDFETVKAKINKRKTWIDCNKKVLYSREIKKRQYYAILKKYNPTTNNTDFYIMTCDDIQYDIECKTLIQDNYKRIKIYINDIWLEANLHVFVGLCSVFVTPLEHTPEHDLYLINLPNNNINL